jgi:hypothetical protein
MSSRRYPEEFKIEAVEQSILVTLLLPHPINAYGILYHRGFFNTIGHNQPVAISLMRTLKGLLNSNRLLKNPADFMQMV